MLFYYAVYCWKLLLPRIQQILIKLCLKCIGFIPVYRQNIACFKANVTQMMIVKIKIRGATAPKSQDRLKRLLPDGSRGGLLVSKALIPQP